jgi:ferredoxin
VLAGALRATRFRRFFVDWSFLSGFCHVCTINPLTLIISTITARFADNGRAALASINHYCNLMSRSVTVQLYGKKTLIVVEDSESILEAAIRQNLDPPYACQIGSCCTCRAKKLSGEVVMDDREALTDEEIADGYVLTCQSHPTTDDVVVDYDA